MSQDEPAVNTEVTEQEVTAPESAPEEKQTPEVADDSILKALSDDDESPEAETKDEPESPEDTEETQETETEEQPQGDEKPLTPKSENRFQQLANENRVLKEQIEKLNNQVYQPQTVEELVDEGLSPELAEVRSLKQQLEVQDFNNRVYEANVALSQESERVIKDFPMFDPEHEDFDAEIAADAAEQLAANLIHDPNTGAIIGYRTSPYKIYKPIADAHKKALLKGQIKGQKSSDRMQASVDAPMSATPKEPKKDPLLEILSSDD